MNTLWEKRKLPGYIYSFTPSLEFVRFQDLVSREYSESVFPYGTRGLEIGEWLRLNTTNITKQFKYVILDDNDDFPAVFKEHVVLTDPVYGITKDTLIPVIEKLL